MTSAIQSAGLDGIQLLLVHAHVDDIASLGQFA